MPDITAEDIATVLEAVGDSWPAAIVVVSIVVGVIAIRVLPRLKDVVEGVHALQHELKPNSGKSLRDSVDRIEKAGAETRRVLDEHVQKASEWQAQVEDVLTTREN